MSAERDNPTGYEERKETNTQVMGEEGHKQTGRERGTETSQKDMRGGRRQR